MGPEYIYLYSYKHTYAHTHTHMLTILATKFTNITLLMSIRPLFISTFVNGFLLLPNDNSFFIFRLSVDVQVCFFRSVSYQPS